MQPERQKAQLAKQHKAGQSSISANEPADVRLISMATYALLRVSEAAENLFEEDTKH